MYTVIVEGTYALALLLDSATVTFPRATVANVTVPVELFPPTTVVGLNARLFTITGGAGLTVICCATVLSTYVASMVAVFVFVVESVDIVKLALLLPDGIARTAGTVATDISELRRVKLMFESAAAPSVTVPVVESGPMTIFGLITNDVG